MLQRRLIRTLLAALAALAAPACGGSETALEDNVVRPGITAMAEARDQTCDLGASALRTAIESYRLLEGSPPADEAALVAAGFLSGESSDWDVADGELVAVNPACAASATPVTVEIVTEEVQGGAAAATADQVFAGFDDAFVAGVGGADCARELAVVAAAGARFTTREGAEPTSLDDLRDDLEEPVVLWAYDPVADDLVPSEGSPCIARPAEPGDG